MWREYGDEVQFFVVYIREAHAIDSKMAMGGGDMPILEDPLHLYERQQVARVCMSKLALEPMPALVDDLDDEVSRAYSAWPDRLYLIDEDGVVAFQGGPGPFSFDPGALEAAIRLKLGLPALEPEEVDRDSAE